MNNRRKRQRERRRKRREHIKRAFPHTAILIPWIDGKPDESMAIPMPCGKIVME